MKTFRSVKALAEILNEGADAKSFSPHGIRHYVREADTNGLAPHIKRLGKKILIDEEGFRKWIDAYGNGGEA